MPELHFTLSIEVYDRGEEPEYHREGRTAAEPWFGPWYRWEARITDGLKPLLAEDIGFTPSEAIQRAASRLTSAEPHTAVGRLAARLGLVETPSPPGSAPWEEGRR